MLSSLSLAHLASEDTATRDWAKRGGRLRWLPVDSRYAVTSFRSTGGNAELAQVPLEHPRSLLPTILR